MATHWQHALSRRAREAAADGDEIAQILGGVPAGVLAVTGGFPNPATFPDGVLDELAARLVRDDRAVALQYSPTAGLPSVREYLRERQRLLQGREPAHDELFVTSGGMECIELAARSLLDPGDDVAVEGPTYLGALQALRAHHPRITAFDVDEDGLDVAAFTERLQDGYRPKLLYTIPDYQNPSGRTLSLPRRRALVDACRRHDVVLLEDVAYRETAFDGQARPSLWSLGPDVTIQAGTFSKVLFPGVRLGWAAGPAELIAAMTAAKQTTDQCAGAFGQRLLEAFGRGGHFERTLPRARAFYAAQWAAARSALAEHLPAGSRFSEPTGGFFTWVELPEGLDTGVLRADALQAGVAYVPGRPFFPGPGGEHALRFSFSLLAPDELREAARRLGAVVDRAQVHA